MAVKPLEKLYRWSELEDRWYQHWLKQGYFHAKDDSDKKPYTIVIPPPNVTGRLTMGHVLNNTIQDILIRKARMEGANACWIPGTDHASIATEGKVVKMLKDQGIRKEDLSRAEFLDHAWQWKQKYGGIIISQLKKLGCSCDWDREVFTMDEDYSRAVLTAFVHLYEKGYIYRGHRLVNWCPVSKSAISDEEVIYREVQGHLWTLRYPLKDSDKSVMVATTRPETMLGDTAVAVHPKDERYQHLVGETVLLPLVGREIPIIADDFVDPEFGTGCVKVTPAHDPNDFEIGKRHQLEFINIMEEDASMNDQVPEAYRGLTREEARKQVVADMAAQGFLVKTEDYSHKVGYSERGHVPIESYLSDQWFLKMSALAKPALEAVNNGSIRFHPDHWVKTYNHWLENLRDWCISRQLWWGHQIPVWYHKDDRKKLHVSVEGPPDPENWVQDPDVLDTWASSWLWPFAVHGWPEAKKSLSVFYPTDTLVTGPDIIFFWVARMIMAGYEFMGELPFRDVYFTSILRDEEGRKFSKSLGNSPEPFHLFEQHGTDAVRFGIMLMSPQGLDVLFSNSRLEVGRNFMNKLWNAARFVQMNLEKGSLPTESLETFKLELPEQWIISQLNRTAEAVNKKLEQFHFNEAAKSIYEFTWSDFCDWYIEIAKTRFQGKDPQRAQMARTVAVHVLKGILRLLHPMAPFITEELWSHFRAEGEEDLIVTPWIEGDPQWLNPEAETSLSLIQDVVSAVRMVRSRMNVPPSKKADLVIRKVNGYQGVLQEHELIIRSLARLDSIVFGNHVEKPAHSATVIVQKMELFIPLEGLIDLDKEQARLSKRLQELEGHLNVLKRKLDNNQFLQRAPEKVVNQERKKYHDMTEEYELVKSNLEMLQ